jgi:hypothetical protein
MSAYGTPVTWRKSSFSQNGDCIELACGNKQVFVRDSKDVNRRTLSFRLADWTAFVARVKSSRHPWHLVSDL